MVININQFTIVDCTFESNKATSNGGALYISGGLVTVENCTFTTNNATSNGGAIYWSGHSGTLNTSTFINNIAKGQSHDVYNAAGDLTIVKNHFTAFYLDEIGNVLLGYNATEVLKSLLLMKI